MKAARFGLHASTAGGLDNAAREAVELGANCLQIFSSSPRMWRSTPLDSGRIHAFRMLREKHDLTPLVIHCNYLINLAATDPEVLRNSALSFRGELERAVAIGADYLVLHPGSKKGHDDAETAMQLAAASVAAAARGIVGIRVLFENTAGAGQSIGSTFEELAYLAGLVRRVSDLPFGFCIDTCHCLAAGYDVATAEGLEGTLLQLDSQVGIGNVPVLHANDSKGALGSHLDRHANIGEGQIGLQGFRGIVNHPLLAEKAFILETPMEDDGGRRDLETLRRLRE